MTKKKKKEYLNLMSTIEKDSWFYEGNEELCDPYLGMPYLSYSSHTSLNEYFGDFIKEKIAGIELGGKIYAELGTFVGEALEHGVIGENPHGFTGLENLDLTREEGVEYEKMIIIDRGTHVYIGFIDKYEEDGDLALVSDYKTGGKDKEKYYTKKEYFQTTLYAYYVSEILGKEVKETYINFIRRTGSHVRPPMNISEEQFTFALPYNKTRVNYTLKSMDKSAKEIASIKTTFDKYFK